MSKNFKSTNYKHGILVDIDGTGSLTDERFIPGSRDEVMFSQITASNLASIFWIAPAPCKVISVVERHGVVAGQAGTAQIEKVPSGTAVGSGTAVLASALDLTSTVNTNVTVLASSTLATASLAKGDALAGKVASGSATSYAGGIMTVTVEWL